MPRQLWLLLIAEVASVTGLASFPTLLPELFVSWSLSSTDAGVVNGAFFAGYALASPILTGLTDQHDARRIYLSSALLSFLAQLLFAWFAEDVLSAAILRALFGVGVAGTFMPAITLLPPFADAAKKSRAISTYTATFGLGVSLSYVITALLHVFFDLRTTLLVVALGPLVGLAIVALFFTKTAPKPGASSVLTGLFRAWRHAPARRYGLVYAGHCAELFALRSWSVVLLSAKLGALSTSPLFAPMIAAVTNATGAPFSVLGNEGALRTGRRRWITRVLFACPLFATGLGLSYQGPSWLTICAALLYAACVALDSGAMTAGTFEAAPDDLRGAVAALHTTLGFIGGFFGPMIVGVVLDAFGGPTTSAAWTFAFAGVSVCALVLGIPLVRAKDQTVS